MGLSDVQNPYDPSGWTGRVEIVEYDPVTLTGGGSVPICPPDPSRLWLLVASDVVADQWVLWPYQQSAPYGLRSTSSSGWILIHSASYPGAVQSQWYGMAAGLGVDVHIVAGRAITDTGG